MAVDPTTIQSGEAIYFMNGNLPTAGEVAKTNTEPLDVDTQSDTYYLVGQGTKKFTLESGKVNSIYTSKEDFIDALTILINAL